MGETFFSVFVEQSNILCLSSVVRVFTPQVSQIPECVYHWVLLHLVANIQSYVQ